MSEAVAKAERRDLRRTVGASGLAVVDQHADLLTKLKHNVEVLAARVTNLEEEQHLMGDRVEALEKDTHLEFLSRVMNAAARDGHAFRHMPFWRRFRWLFTGRMH